MNTALQQNYLKWANAAIQHCRWTFVIGTNNKQDDIIRTGGWSAESVNKLRQQSTATAQPTDQAFVETLASEAEAARCGNCGEQAAVAFEYMRQKFSARPLDFMILNPSRAAIHSMASGVCDGDHAFVVVGRTGGNDANLQTWDVEAVVCDPWAGLVCPAFEYGGKGPCGAAWHPTKSLYRVA